MPNFPPLNHSFILLASMWLPGFDPLYLPPIPSLTARGLPLSPVPALALVLVNLMLEEESVVSWRRDCLLCYPHY